MRTTLTTVSVVAFSLGAFAHQAYEQGEHINLQVGIIIPGGILGGGHKTPPQPPYVTLDDHTLYIWSEHSGYTLTLTDDNGTVVYQTYVAAGVQYDALPSSLSGSYTLQLSNDTFVFTGMIELY